MPRSMPMPSVMFLAALLAAALTDGVRAQDVPGIENCSAETRLDRRTGCLQSNVEYLLQQAAKTNAVVQQRLAAQAAEIAALKTGLAAMQAKIDALQARAPTASDKPAK